MPDLPGERGPYAIVNWEPVLHLLANDAGFTWICDNYGRLSTCHSQCGEIVSGYLHDASKHVVTCLTCLVEAGWR